MKAAKIYMNTNIDLLYQTILFLLEMKKWR